MTASSPDTFTHATGHHAFRDGKYYCYTKTSVTVMAGWPRLLAWKRSARQPQWQMLRPDCGKPSLQDPQACAGACALSGTMERSAHCRRGDGDCLLAHDPWRHWSAQIPSDVREAVAAYGSRHWHLLSMAARCGKPAVDLMHANPALAWALASSWVFRGNPVRDPMRSVRRLLAPGKTQRDILAWLDFPATDSARRQLRKLPARCVTVNSLLALRDALRDPPALKRLTHLPVLNPGVIRVVADPGLRAVASHALLLDIAVEGNCPLSGASPDRNEENYASSAMTLQDCLRMLAALGEPAGQLRGLRSRAALVAFHDDLVARMHREPGATPRAPLLLPPPPLTDTATIQGLCTEDELRVEGIVMQHCVGSYGPLVASGEVAVYRVLAPERATLAIARAGNGWRIRELKCAGNVEATPETWRATQAWLRSPTSM